MRIIHVIPSLEMGGAEKMCIDICNALSDMGHNILLVRLSEEQDFDESCFRFSTIVIKERARLRFMRGLARVPSDWQALIKDFSPDIIHSHLFEAEVLTKSVLRSNTAYFTHCHDNMHQFKRGFKVSKLLNKKEYVRVYERRFLLNRYRLLGQNHFICISESNEAYFKKNLTKGLAVFKLPNAIAFGNYNRGAISPENQDVLRLISVGSLTSLKNHHYLVRVVQELCKKSVRVHLDLLGGGPMRTAITTLVQQLSLDNAVSLQGKQINVIPFYQKNHLYVHSARSEGFGLTQVEAMAAGLPVIALDAAGNRDIVQNGRNGYLLSQDTTPEAFADKILAVWQDKGALKSLQEGAIKTASQFDIKPYCERLVRLYEDAQC